MVAPLALECDREVVAYLLAVWKKPYIRGLTACTLAEGIVETAVNNLSSSWVDQESFRITTYRFGVPTPFEEGFEKQ